MLEHEMKEGVSTISLEERDSIPSWHVLDQMRQGADGLSVVAPVESRHDLAVPGREGGRRVVGGWGS